MKKKVLVIDDEPTYRELLQLGLGELGFAVEVASTADAALRIASSFRPDVVVVDQILRDRMHGSELAGEILLRLPGCGIVMVSGCVAANRRWAGECAWLSKPFELDELASVIRSLPKLQHGCDETANTLESTQHDEQ